MSFIFDAREGWDPTELRRAYRKYGLVIIRGVLSPAEVAESRAELDQTFRESGMAGRYLPNFVYKETTTFRRNIKPLVFKALRDAFGGPLSLHQDYHVQRNAIAIGGTNPNSGWHYDCGSELQYLPHDYLRRDDYCFAKVALFLQDFDNDWGGGVRFIPGTHRRFFGPALSRFWRRLLAAYPVILRKLGSSRDPIGAVTGPTRAGDLCFFDSRLVHTSSLPSAENIARIGYTPDQGSFWRNIPAERTKYVMYIVVGVGEASAMYLRNTIRRAFYEEPLISEDGRPKRYSFSAPGKEPMFTMELAMRAETDLPADVRESLKAQEIRVAEADPDFIAYAKKRLALMTADPGSAPRD